MNVYLPYTARLPSEYQEVEYIQSTGNQYIDTGYNYNGTYFRIDCKILYNSYSWGGEGANLPTMTGVIGRSYGNMFMSLNPDTHVFGFSTGTQYETNFVAQLGTIYETMLEYKSGTMNMKINNSEFSTSSSGTFYTGKSIPIFCRWDIQYSGLYSYFTTDVKLYNCKIYSAENVLARDFVPCYRKSDNVIGLYDLVNNQFYTNSGSGTFSKGNDVTMVELKNAYIGEVWTPGSNTLAYYPLATDTKDYSGNGRDGTNSNVTFSNGVGVFNGSNAMVTVADASWQRPGNNMTISLWGKANSWTHTESGQDLFLLGKFQFYSSGLNNMFYRIIIVNSTKNALGGFSSGADYNTYPLETTAPISLDTWYLYTITTEGTSKKFYLNGTLINQATSNTTTSTNSVPLTIGNGWYNNHQAYFNGNISNVILENKTWTASEISHYYDIAKANYGL